MVRYLWCWMLDHWGFKGWRRVLGEQWGTHDLYITMLCTIWGLAWELFRRLRKNTEWRSKNTEWRSKNTEWRSKNTEWRSFGYFIFSVCLGWAFYGKICTNCQRSCFEGCCFTIYDVRNQRRKVLWSLVTSTRTKTTSMLFCSHLTTSNLLSFQGSWPRERSRFSTTLSSSCWNSGRTSAWDIRDSDDLRWCRCDSRTNSCFAYSAL